MAHTVDSISIRGLRKSHLRQLVAYIRERDHDGWYYGPREQFERRHVDLLALADRIEAIANDADARLPNAPDQARLQPSPEAGGSVCHAKMGHHDDPRPHHCLLPAGHDGRHFCHICGLYWDTPNVGGDR